jgi:hypothetical protein
MDTAQYSTVDDTYEDTYVRTFVSVDDTYVPCCLGETVMVLTLDRTRLARE